MSEARDHAAGEGNNVRRLSDAIREVKNAMADRDDVVVEMREVTRTRLELLAAELEALAAEAGAEHPGFDFAISSGQQPRYWVDAVAHVALGRDRRTYRFVRDTRNGRVVLAEATDVRPVADAVALYVAERIVERRRDLDAEPAQAVSAPPEAPETAAAAPSPKRGRAQAFFSGLALVMLGAIVGATAIVLVLRERVPDIQTLF